MSFQTRKFELQQDVTINAMISSPASTTKPTLVFLHYWGGSSRMWLPVMKRLSSYESIALDFRGWGDSTGPPAKDDYSISMLAADVEAVINELNLDSFTLVGLSMGAKVAQVVAAHNPAGLRSAILLSPAPLSPFQLLPKMREQQIHAYDAEETAAFVTSNVLTASSPSKEIIGALVTDQLRGNRWAKAAWPTYGMSEDYAELAPLICVPVLVVAAEKDVIEPPDRVRREVQERIEGSQWTVILGSGHLSPVDCAEAVASEIDSFMVTNS